jgi:hypothetical protein
MAINTPIGVCWGKGKSMKSTRALHLVSGLDGGSAAADASNFWTELASLF